ncbi:DUF1700 domain-containing protein [Peptostreptococcus faecalis]|uniref:DUF1700 domain-containing protein n=1 Tax=Peptostreptococcus faecalis TaxID=2045015 RepID=UPI000C7A2A0F|nr:DUF1700 domain-containing protein [Peptostreptococcus faecalis]
MNKRLFMDDLSYFLRLAYSDISPDEVDDILRDYEEYFMDGFKEGKNDDEITESLGDPKKIVDEMIENDIELGKYTKDDFKKYFEYSYLGNKVEEYEEVKDFRYYLNKMMKAFGYIMMIFFDIFYYLMLFSIGLGILSVFIVGMISIPYGHTALSVVGASGLLVIFPLILMIGLFLLSIVAVVLMFKLGFVMNRLVFGVSLSQSMEEKFLKFIAIAMVAIVAFCFILNVVLGIAFG